MSFDKEINTEMKIMAEADRYKEGGKNYKGMLIILILVLSIPPLAYFGYQKLEYQARAINNMSNWTNLPTRLENLLESRRACIATTAIFSRKNSYVENVAFFAAPNKVFVGPGYSAGLVKVNRIDGKLIASPDPKFNKGLLVFEIHGLMSGTNTANSQRMAIPIELTKSGHVAKCLPDVALKDL